MLSNYYNDLLQHSLLSKEETYQLISEYQNVTSQTTKQQIEEKLIRHNFKYIYKLSTRFCNSHPNSNLDDCIQTASIAFRKALEKFDLTRNLSFSTYLTWWLKSYLQRYWQITYRTLYV